MYSNCGLQPLRQYWQEINRHNRHLEAQRRAKSKVRDKRRSKCRCEAYKFPHRPGGGLCRYPDPPQTRWQDREAAEIAERVAKCRDRWGEPTPEGMADLIALTTKPTRPYRKRYTGIVRQICRNNGLHPVRDRELIAKIMLNVKYYAKQIHRENPAAKYRNMEIAEFDGNNLTIHGNYRRRDRGCKR